MSTALNIVTGILALGIGFAAGNWRAGQIDSPNAADAGSVEAITFTGKGVSSPGIGESGDFQFSTFREAIPRLDSLILEFGALTPFERYQLPVRGERLLQEIERHLGLAKQEELIEWIKGLDQSREIDGVLSVAIGVLARLSPEATAQTFLELERDHSLYDDSLLTLVRVWESKDSAALERWIEGLGDDLLRTAARGAFLTVKAGTDPGFALSKIDAGEPGLAFNTQTLGLALDLERCPEAASKLLETSSEKNLLSTFLGSWGTRDAEAMMAWLFAQDLESLGPDVAQQSFFPLIAKDPKTFLETLSPKLADQPALQHSAGQAWWAWITTDGEEEKAIEWLRENSASATGFGSWQIADHFANQEDWTAERTKRVLTALATLPQSDSLTAFSQDFLERLSRYQGKTVAEFAVDHLPLGSKSDMTLSHAVGNWAKTEPEAAVRWSLEHLDSDGAREVALRFSFSHWSKVDPQAAAELALTLPEKERNSAFFGMDAWAETDPAGAVAFLKSTPDAAAVTSLTQATFRQFSENRSGAQYLPEALAMPPGRMRHDAMRGLFGGWALSDADAGAAAIEKVPEGSLRDAAIQGFNGYAIGRNPKLAIDLATRISVATTRDKELINRGRYWLGRDRPAAEATIRAHAGIPDSVKAEIFK